MKEKSKEANEKQKLFCIEYLKDFNATQAAIRAGYSSKVARQQGSRLLTNVDIQNEITRQVDALLEGDKLLLKKQLFDLWMKRAFYDITEIVDLQGNLKIDEKKLREEGLHVCIDGITRKVNAQGIATITYKFADRDKAVDMLQRYIHMIKDQPIEIKTDSPLVDITALLIKQTKDPKEGERIIAELEKVTGYAE